MNEEELKQEDFFMLPPVKIGDILFSHTTLEKHVKPKKIITKIGGTLVAIVVTLLFSSGFVYVTEIESSGWAVILLTIFPFTIGVIYYRNAAFKHTCCYVGKNGGARYLIEKERGNLVIHEVFLFESATSIKASETDIRTNGLLSDELFKYEWYNNRNELVYSVSGNRKDYNPDFKYAEELKKYWHVYNS